MLIRFSLLTFHARLCGFKCVGSYCFVWPYGSTNVTHVSYENVVRNEIFLKNFSIYFMQMGFCRFLQLATEHLLTTQLYSGKKNHFFRTIFHPLEMCHLSNGSKEKKNTLQFRNK